MYTTEDYEFRKDVYTSLIRIANYRVSGYLAGERKACGNDFVFYTFHLDATDELIGRAFRKGKLIASNTEIFLDTFRKVVNDDVARQVFLHQDALAALSIRMFESISTEDSRLKNVFNRYWKDRCSKSVKVLYYRYLITDSSSPKYDGLGPDASLRLYGKIRDFIGVIKSYLNQSTPPPAEPITLSAPTAEVEHTPVPEIDRKSVNFEESISVPESDVDEVAVSEPIVESSITSNPNDGNLAFLSYIYDNVVSVEYPASAILLSVLRRRLNSDKVFFEKVLAMDQAGARIEMGIGEVSARDVVRLCDMMRRVVNHSGAYDVFNHPEKANLAQHLIEERVKTAHIRIYHSYQKFIESCDGSIVTFYLRVAGIDRESVKFEGLNQNKSKELLDIFISLLNEIDEFVNGDEQSPEMKYRPYLISLKMPTDHQYRVLDIANRSGHFPFFAVLSWYLESKSEDRDKTLYSRALNLYHGSAVEDLNTIAASMGLSRERVRQLRDECYDFVIKSLDIFKKINLLGDYKYEARSEYDFNHIREEEGVSFSNEYIIVGIHSIMPGLKIIGDVKKSLLKNSGAAHPLYLVSSETAKIFDFQKFIDSVEEMLQEKRFYPYRDDLETFIRGMNNSASSDNEFYDILRECRQILEKGYPDNIINSQIYFPANARKAIPLLIEDILREYNRPMTAEEISNLLNERYPELEQIPSKIGANALRNPNIVAVSRSSTYALAEWNATDKRGGTIRDLAVEYLNSLIQPIAPLTDICEYISKFREDIKEGSVKANLLAESNNRFSIYYKGDVLHIGYTDVNFGDDYKMIEKRQGRRTFKDSLDRLEQFIKANGRFPFTSGVDGEEARLSRFYAVAKANQKKGALEPDELAELERIDGTYGHLKVKKERISWDERLERFVKYITDNESLPYPSSKEYAWYLENKALYDAGELDEAHRQSFSFLVKIVERMNNPLNL